MQHWWGAGVKRSVSCGFSPLLIGSSNATTTRAGADRLRKPRFSPLLIGSSNATKRIQVESSAELRVSVPYSSGQAMQLFQYHWRLALFVSFSPLLIGSSNATPTPFVPSGNTSVFQSPTHRVKQCNLFLILVINLYSLTFQSPTHRVKQCNRCWHHHSPSLACLFQSPTHRVKQCNTTKYYPA